MTERILDAMERFRAHADHPWTSGRRRRSVRRDFEAQMGRLLPRDPPEPRRWAARDLIGTAANEGHALDICCG